MSSEKGLLTSPQSIVSEVEGTTRDSVEARLIINQYPINLIDTAGYFEANDQINIDSVKQTMNHAKNADIIICLDERDPINEFSKLNLDCSNVIYCKSKQDQAVKHRQNNQIINLSSQKNYGINDLKDKLSTVLSTEYEYDIANQTALISDRQIIIFEQALEMIINIQILLKDNIGMDVVASYMHQLSELLVECLGKVSNDEVLYSIFYNFCVGK